MTNKKELKEEDLNKVSGGENTKEKCPSCNQEYWTFDVIVIDRWICCPHCKTKLYPIGT